MQFSWLTEFVAEAGSRTLRRAAKGVRALDYLPTTGSSSRLHQLQLLNQYSLMRTNPEVLPALSDVRFDVFSPEGEDGILLYIFGLLGFKSRRCVDIGGAGITVSNTANLVVHHDFQCLLLDGNPRATARTATAYRRYRPSHSPMCVTSWITSENINSLLIEYGMAGQIDLLSIDLDGIDWWILDALAVTRPRVLIVEYQDILGADRSWTVPYRPNFSIHDYPVNAGGNYNYCGASLRAFVNLLTPRGYRLVGCNRNGYNAFFVDALDAGDLLPEVAVESCLESEWNKYGLAQRFPTVADMAWTSV